MNDHSETSADAERIWELISAHIDTDIERRARRRRLRQTGALAILATALVGVPIVGAASDASWFPLGFDKGSAPSHLSALQDDELPLASPAVRSRFHDSDRLAIADLDNALESAGISTEPRVLVIDGNVRVVGAAQRTRACFAMQEFNRTAGVTCSTRLHRVGVAYSLEIRLGLDEHEHILVGVHADEVDYIRVVMRDGSMELVQASNNGFLWRGTQSPAKLQVEAAGAVRTIVLPHSNVPLSGEGDAPPGVQG